MGSGQWEEPPVDLALLSDDIHVWRASLDQPAACAQRLAQTLSAEERWRAERFHFERDRLRFIVSRGVLRMILGRYLGIEPGRLQFDYSLHGKPSLAKMPNRGGGKIYFNLSHSHGLALYAIAQEQEIGIDLEYIRPIVEADQIVQQFFSNRERAMFCALPMNQKQGAFFNCWTRKEAYLKASGRGLDWPLDKVEVSLAPGEPARLLSIAGDHQEASSWFIQALTPVPGYVAALAVKGHGWQFNYWDFDETQYGLGGGKYVQEGSEKI
jgi:4'-phosphopantetheinyl transferase